MASRHFTRPIDRVRARAQRLAIRARYAAISGALAKREGAVFDTTSHDAAFDRLNEALSLPPGLFRRWGARR